MIAGNRNGGRITLIKLPYVGNKPMFSRVEGAGDRSPALPHRVSGGIRFVVETKTMPRARFYAVETWKLARNGRTIHLWRSIATRTTTLGYPELINTSSSARLSDIRALCSVRLPICRLSRRRSTLPTISTAQANGIPDCIALPDVSTFFRPRIRRTRRFHAPLGYAVY